MSIKKKFSPKGYLEVYMDTSLSRVVPCSRKKQQNSGFMFPFFSFFWVGFFALFRAFRALPSL